MAQIVNYLKCIVDIMDQHEGMVAMLGIAVTVFIFVREVSRNYFTMEQDNFKDIFKDLTLKQLPDKIDAVEFANDEEWSDRFKELVDILDKILVDSKYYKYTIPFFYECLRLRIDEIRDLERHDNWRLYRSGVKQNELIKKKCRAIIKNINNASKGKVFSIKIYQNRLIQKLRFVLKKNLDDHPADRITEKYTECSNDKFVFKTKSGELIPKSSLKKITVDSICIETDESNIQIVNVKGVGLGEVYFGYAMNIRWGKYIGKIIMRVRKGNLIQIKHNCNQAFIKLKDTDLHKVVLMWKEGNDKNHIYFSKFNIRRK